MKSNAQILELHDWLILDALSDDYESVEQIVQIVSDDWPSAPPLEIIDRLEQLNAAGHVFLTREEIFDRDEMVREFTQTSSRFWFGRTASGDALWQRYAAAFGYE